MKVSYLSASRIKKYQTCPHSYYFLYEEGLRSEAVHLDFGTLMHTVFERWFQEDENILAIYEEEWSKGKVTDFQYYQDGKDMLNHFLVNNDRNKIYLGFEVPFEIEITDNVKILGFIDRIDYIDDKTIRIVDYKTSRVPLTSWEADSDVQLSMYYYVAKKLYPEFERVELELQYVRYGTSVRSSRGEGFEADFEKFLVHVHNQITNDHEHKPRLNSFCSWCEGKDKCPAYKDAIANASSVLAMFNDDREGLASELETIGVHLKILEDRKKEIEEKFKLELKTQEARSMTIGKKEVYLASSERVNYDVETVKQLFPNEFTSLISIRKTAVDKLVGRDKEKIDLLNKTKETYYIAPALRVKNLKKE